MVLITRKKTKSLAQSSATAVAQSTPILGQSPDMHGKDWLLE